MQLAVSFPLCWSKSENNSDNFAAEKEDSAETDITDKQQRGKANRPNPPELFQGLWQGEDHSKLI